MQKRLQPALNWLKKVFEEQQGAQQKSTISVLDGVRALAILFVLTFHINWADKHYLQLWDWRAFPLGTALALAGESGVTLFFVLSGFLLFLPYARALLFAGRWPLALSFYVRRALRILPAYYLSLLVLILWEQRDYFLPANLPKLLLFVSFFMDSSRLTFRLLDGPFWTLAVEWQFYMILPLLALGFLLLVRRISLQKRLPAVAGCLLGVIAVSLMVRLWGFYYRDHPHATFWLPRQILDVVQFFTFGIVGKYIEVFSVGMLLSLWYVYTQKLTTEHHFVRNSRRLSPWLLGLGLCVLMFTALGRIQVDLKAPVWPFLGPLMSYYEWLSEPLQAAGYGLCIFALLFSPPAWQRPLNWTPLRWIGMISFSVYIWHLPLFQLLQAWLRTMPNLNFYVGYALYWVWALVVIFPFSLLCYIVVEKPGMLLGDRWRKAIEARRTAVRVEPVPAPKQPIPTRELVTPRQPEARLDVLRQKAEVVSSRR